VPFVLECIRTADADVVSMVNLQTQLAREFRLSIPQSVLSVILRRAARRGFLRVDNHTYRRIPEQLSDFPFDKTRNLVLAQYAHLVGSFMSYSQERHGAKVTIGEAELALESFLSSNELRILASVAGNHQDSSITVVLSPSERYIVADFLRYIETQRSYDWQCFETIAEGHMLANSVFLPDISQAGRKFRGTRVYCDTPILLGALGYANRAMAAPCEELLDLLAATGAEVWCLSSTLEEMQRALGACAYRLESGEINRGYGPSMEYFLDEGLTASEVRMLMGRMQGDLAKHGIGVSPTPSYGEHEYVVDEKFLEAELLRNIPDHRPEALRHDVGAVSAMARLRRGSRPLRIEECGAVFVTKNGALARAGRALSQREYGDMSIALCITDFALTNLLWLKLPSKAPDLARKRVIADCYAATNPGKALWLRYMTEVEHLKSRGDIAAEDVYMLRYSLPARDELMELTHGEDEVITEGTVQQILAKVDARRRADVVFDILKGNQ
jgi:hypothetical protein